MSSNLAETKICVQKLLPHHQREINAIRGSGHSPGHMRKLEAAFFTKKLWPKGSKIVIGFIGTGNQVRRTNLSDDSNVDPLQKEVEDLSVRQAVRKVIKERIIPLVDLDIRVLHDDDPIDQANVRVSFDPSGGAWSLVGTDHLHQKTGATINLGWFDVPTTIHEFGHMLGMIHEHQNPDGEKIKWNDAKVFAWAKNTQGWSEQTTEQNIIDKYNRDAINGSSFDPQSIMLYFFPGYLTTNDVGTQQNLRLSGEDTLWISKMYPKKHGISPEKFYKMNYGQTLQSSVEESRKLAAKFGKGGTSDINWKTIGVGLFIVVGLILIAVLIWWLVKRKESSGRYGR